MTLIVLARELDVHSEATIEIGRRPDAAVVRLHDRTADCETHAQAAGFAADESLEHPLQVRLFRADPAVADRDFHHPSTTVAGSDRDLPQPVLDVGDRL